MHLLQTGLIQVSLETSTPFTRTPIVPPMRLFLGTITHGMFATRRYVEVVVTMGVPDRVFN